MSPSNKKAFSDRQKTILRLSTVWDKDKPSLILRVVLFVLPLAVGLYLLALDHQLGVSSRPCYVSHDILLAVGTGLVVYFVSVSIPNAVKCFKLSHTLAKRYMRYKERVIAVFSASVGSSYFKERLKDVKTAKWCREFFRGYVDEDHGAFCSISQVEGGLA